LKATLIAPVFDDITPYSYEWSREICKKLVEKGYEVADLSGDRISRNEVEVHLPDTDIFVFYDHGSENALWGSRDESVINLNNCKMLAEKECYTMACLSAKRLGVEIWRNKAKYFWGYYEVFSFTTDALEEFKEFANKGLLLRLEGKPIDECLRLTKALGYELSRKLSSAGKYIASVCMKRNADALRCYNAETPTTRCMFRALALKVFGRKGWFISRLRGLTTLIFGIGFGISLHDFAHQVYQLKGTVLSMEGGYIGFALVLLAFIIEFKDFLRGLNES